MLFFEWTPYVYGAFYRDSIVMLKVDTNKYLALDPDTSKYMRFILNTAFSFDGNVYSAEGVVNSPIKEDNTSWETDNTIIFSKLNDCINTFLKEGLIEIASSELRKNRVAVPKQNTGLAVQEWFPKSHGVPLDKVLMMKGLYYLYKAHSAIKRHNIEGIVQLLQKFSYKAQPGHHSMEHSKLMSRAMDQACTFYPRKTLCLPYAAALTIMHFAHGYDCDFIIGVQSIPFHSHAWVEVNNNVLTDNEELKEKMAYILRINHSGIY
ncbi:Transglutaminase-like superfamily domain protein [Candidatus Cyrtobacter comes]|uniref:Transglutaminase-like superfamily domain protein n=1 Tax=Candidatus Cyrtobacter comes TaxID=675776 RepID=A0ABU5L9P2_9RICK|nr:lasso peptide biosynthesis B2 protein [Candidatus Cyrtobacter comes]MDZ5762840.1 Transglutaminase-like superfamily domain protein [Candidatus Cyrtobacter comes]